jgi:hypothetical protein
MDWTGSGSFEPVNSWVLPRPDEDIERLQKILHLSLVGKTAVEET